MPRSCVMCGTELITQKSCCSRRCARAYRRKRLAESQRPSKLEDRIARVFDRNRLNYLRQVAIGRYVVDFLFEKRAIVLEVDGCFWHACQECGYAHKQTKRQQFKRMNRERYLLNRGYVVAHILEHDVKALGPVEAIKRAMLRTLT